ncbi:hypothetical protein [Agathobacter sp.]|uniref:hypothetical protein n=1 Tax=Agathobacter sp. TaxID=2021311 RepID=UPI003FD7A72D
MKKMNIQDMKAEAKEFGKIMSSENHKMLIGVNDGKKIGTYIEHRFQEFVSRKYEIEVGNSAFGIDLPSVETDIKSTSIVKPQSSCPFRNAKQKIYGLGYNLLIFVYDKTDTTATCTLDFKYCTFVEATRTADFTTTKRLREMIDDGANKEDIIGYLTDKNLPGDEIVYSDLADEILCHTPEQGYLTVTNANQWRLSYGRVIKLDNAVSGVWNYGWN